MKTFDVAGILACVGKGLSYRALERVRQAADLPAAQFCDLVSIPPRTLARRKKAGRLEPDESDRLLRLARKGSRSVALAVPSVIVPSERNYLLSPGHPDFARVRIGGPEESWRRPLAPPGHGFSARTQESPRLPEQPGAFNKNPATTYSPTQLPMQYHRR